MSQNLEPFEYDSEQDSLPKAKVKDPNRKMKNLYGDFWNPRSDAGSDSE